MKPTVVFPNLVALATFIEWVIVRLLALSRITNAAIRIMKLPSSPNPSSTSSTHHLSFFHSTSCEQFSAIDYKHF
jgi:hypothetical protein